VKRPPKIDEFEPQPPLLSHPGVRKWAKRIGWVLGVYLGLSVIYTIILDRRVAAIARFFRLSLRKPFNRHSCESRNPLSFAPFKYVCWVLS
jgi:hypothetical protein